MHSHFGFMERGDPPTINKATKTEENNILGRDNPATSASDIPVPVPANNNQSLLQPPWFLMSDTSESRRESVTTSTENDVDGKDTNTPPSKRRLVRTACLPCRKRKSKCDGTLPRCMTCQVHKTECQYDFDADRRRNPSRRYIESLEARVASLEGMIKSVRDADSNALPEIIREIRSGSEDVQYYAPLAKAGSPDVRGGNKTGFANDMTGSPLVELGKIMGTLQLQEGQVRYFGPTSNLSLISTESPTAQPPKQTFAHSPPDSELYDFFFNPELVDHLLKLYWSWQHQYFVILDKDLFLRDLASGGKFASEFLLNAILAHAAPYSTRPGLRSDESDPSTAGYYYFNRARQLLLLDEDIMARPSVVTCQALALLGSREAGCARNARGWILSGMSFRMALDLGLHLDSQRLVELGYLSEEEYNMRAITFWGCFIFDRGWSTYMGRPTVIPCDSINAQRPPIDVEKEAEPWVPYYNPNDPNTIDKTFPDRPSHLCTVFERICTITEVLGSVMASLYASITKFESSSETYRADVIAGLYFRLNSWYKELPSHLRCDPSSAEGVLPPVIIMHMIYHTTMILLFRPFGSQKQIAGIPVSPWELCTASANSIVTLLKLYRSRFSLRYIVNLSVHMVFTAAIVHLVNATSSNESLRRSSKNALRTCTSGFAEIGEVWASASKSLQVVESLQLKWQLQSPSPQEGEPSPMQQKWPQHITYPAVPKPDYEFDTVMPALGEGEIAEAAEGFQQYFMPPQTQNILQNVDPHTGFSNTAFWDYLPFLDGVYEGQNPQSHP